ncbi:MULTISPECIES: hypothetical protein [unclassified Microcoleus]|uniref:hypothetical protein n=1 Tax=unclassified Microcoleus TaxID=2642155 RepID=UPI0025FB5FA0|nr:MULTISPECIES: hypothetical protein [unclassified Microcoleus]
MTVTEYGNQTVYAVGSRLHSSGYLCPHRCGGCYTKIFEASLRIDISRKTAIQETAPCRFPECTQY